MFVEYVQLLITLKISSKLFVILMNQNRWKRELRIPVPLIKLSMYSLTIHFKPNFKVNLNVV